MAWLNDQLQQSQALRRTSASRQKKKKLLVAEVHKEDQDILAKALEALWKLQHFNEYPIRDKFRAVQNGSVGLVNFQLIFLLRRYLMTMKLSRYLIPFFLKRF